MRTKTAKLFLALSFAASMFAASNAMAVSPADSPCDASYFDSLKARAWMEAQREINQNANLIAKPDSVLEYTCFNKFLGVLAQEAPNLFSDNTGLGASETGTLADTVASIVGAAAGSYHSSNFDHAYIGGRAEEDGDDQGNVSAGSYECEQMNLVWEAAKCMNFADKDHDGFFMFADYTSEDYRKLPEECGAPAGDWQTNIDQSAGADVPWQRDDTEIEEYLSRQEEGFTIQTGLTIQGVGGNDGEEEEVEVPARGGE